MDSFLRREDVARLPVLGLVEGLRRALAEVGLALLKAPPGTGKTTLLPLLLLAEDWLAGRKIVMLEPRRLAARAAAARMAALLGEALGERVGYRIRHESRVSAATRIEVVTEGILTRLLQDDPALSNYGLVIFDEFHERHLPGDLGLAFALQSRELLRPDLRLLIMSATLETEALAGFLPPASRLEAEDPGYPVAVDWLERPPAVDFLPALARLVCRALSESEGDLLVFLPGAGEIRRLAESLSDLGPGHLLLPLYGALPRARQDLVFQAAPPGNRKIILATDIAESSLTIPGIQVVVDGGRRRIARFDAASGLDRYETVAVSRAAAEQRRGRAGREAPGKCYRLWSKAEENRRPASAPPEIMLADLTGLALEMALWGVSEAADLTWPTPPPQKTLDQAFALLYKLRAVDQRRRITDHGRELAAFGLHPRLGQMLLRGRKSGRGRTAAALAAWLQQRDYCAREGADDSDIESRLQRLFGGRRQLTGEEVACKVAVEREVSLLVKRLKIDNREDFEFSLCGELLAAAYPDRLGRKRPGGGNRYLLSGGGEAAFAGPEALAAVEFLVICRLSGPRRQARIQLAAAYDEVFLRREFAAFIEKREVVDWDEDRQSLRAFTEELYGALRLGQEKTENPDPALVAAVWRGVFARQGLEILPWTPAARQLCVRIEFLRSLQSGPKALPAATWPDFSAAGLRAALDDWLLPQLAGIRSRAALAGLDLEKLLFARLDWGQRKELEKLAPLTCQLENGRQLKLDYGQGPVPVLTARVQDFFGCRRTPLVAGRPVLLKLLSPARRPVQITDNLEGFWRGSYAAVRKEMRGRYPRHQWPENPLENYELRNGDDKTGDKIFKA
ncbi:MAG TPA: ATP-dependent helicase HrpB [Proteobacteria bacterium]|nr:ATP-dependent helicase HrpB [Pseudomonadota bacterium]